MRQRRQKAVWVIIYISHNSHIKYSSQVSLIQVTLKANESLVTVYAHKAINALINGRLVLSQTQYRAVKMVIEMAGYQSMAG